MKDKGYPLTIVILGLEQAGKTTLLNTIIGKKSQDPLTTIGMNVELIKYKGYTIQAIDVGGQRAFRHTLWSQYAALAKGIIFVFDIFDEARAQEAKIWFYEILKWASSDAVIAFFANKIDLKKKMKNYMSLERIIKLFELDKFSAQTARSFQIFEISAKTGENIDEALSWFFNKITARIKEETQISFVLLYDAENNLVFSNTTKDIELPYDLINSEVYEKKDKNIGTSKLEFDGFRVLIKVNDEFSIVIGTKEEISIQDLNTVASIISETIMHAYTPIHNYVAELEGLINTMLLKLKT